MVTRKAEKGKTSSVKADMYYQTTGDLVTHFVSPVEYILINNSKGDLKMYDPKKNTVLQQSNLMYSTQSTHFYYFLQNRQSDMGLKAIGFKLNDTKMEKGLLVTEWLPPMDAVASLSKVKLVHEGQEPIFMSYIGTNGKPVKNIYYYKYQQLGSVNFPTAVTSINYFTKGDSTIEKTTYSDFKLNEAANSSYFTFKVPANAKALKK